MQTKQRNSFSFPLLSLFPNIDKRSNLFSFLSYFLSIIHFFSLLFSSLLCNQSKYNCVWILEGKESHLMAYLEIYPTQFCNWSVTIFSFSTILPLLLNLGRQDLVGPGKNIFSLIPQYFFSFIETKIREMSSLLSFSFPFSHIPHNPNIA